MGNDFASKLAALNEDQKMELRKALIGDGPEKTWEDIFPGLTYSITETGITREITFNVPLELREE